MDDLIDLIDISQTLVFPWQQTSELAEPKKLLFTCKGWSLQVIITLWLFEFRGYHNQAIYYSNWLRQKPDNAKLELYLSQRNYENRLRGSRYFKQTVFIIIRYTWKMYLEVSGVSKHELGGMREKLKIKGRGHDARYGMGISLPV